MVNRVVIAIFAVLALGLTALNLATSPNSSAQSVAQIHEGGRSGLAKVIDAGTACIRPETISKSWVALDAGDYDTSNQLIAGRDCAKLPIGQAVTLTGRWTELPVGKAPTDLFRFVEYALPSGDLVWGFERSIN